MWSTDADNAKMMLDIPLPTKYVIIDQLALKLVDICLDKTLQILCKSLVYTYALQELGKLTAQKSQKMACKILYVQLQNSISRSVFNESQ